MSTLLYSPPIQQVFDEVNAKNKDTLSTPLTTINVELNDVELLDSSDGRSTFDLYPVDGNDDYRGVSLNINFKRYVANQLFPYRMPIKVFNGNTYDDILTRFAAVYAIPPFVIESTGVTLYDISKGLADTVWHTGDSTQVDIPFAGSSIGYIGTLRLALVDATNDFTQSIENTVLDVLIYP